MIERHMTLTAGDANLERRSEVLLREKKTPASIIPPMNMNIMGIEAVGSRHIHIWLLIGSGVIAAGQIGKAIISLPLIRSEMAVGFDFAGLIVAIFATLGAAIGIAAGAVVGRLGVRRALIGGMAVIGFGNLISAGAENELVLLAARIVEGVGFFGAVLAIPTILAQIIKPTERDFVMGVWSAYLPAGIMLMLCVGPFLPAIGWRTLWLANAVLAAAWSLLLALYAPTIPRRPNASRPRFLTDVVRVVREPRCILLAFTFFTYSCQIFSIAFALPLLLTSAHGMSLGNAGLLSALVLAVSTVGHVSSGFSLRAGVPIWGNLAVAFGFFAISAFAIYCGSLPPIAVALVAGLALGIGGLAPGALYAAVPRAAPTPELVPPTIGLVQQASNLGQFAGPLGLGIWVEHLSWYSAPVLVVPVALLGLLAAFVTRKMASEVK
jgi:predicted MFS family arabinose efflux permease